jgi:ABC-type antimicrobial peptide transport system permease subunit
MKQYLKLLMAREAKEVLGKKGSNLWILTLVLLATFASIAFSEGSMIYLKDKMEDPFTNWVSIAKAIDDNSFNNFRDLLEQDANKRKYDYSNVLMDQFTNYQMMGNGRVQYPSVRFFGNINSQLVKAVLADDNIAEGCTVNRDLLFNKTMGFIITSNAAKNLGYEEGHLPTYISYMAGLKEGADTLGIKLELGGFYAVPFPVLAVVRRLPNNVDMMSANFFYEQQHVNAANTHPFDFIAHEADYLHTLHFYVANDIGEESFDNYVKSVIPDSLKARVQIYDDSERCKDLMTWKPGTIRKIDLGDERLPRKAFQDVADAVEAHYDAYLVRRVHRLVYGTEQAERGSFISVEFNSLKHIREFETFAKSNGIQLEMEQVNSKENFNAVTVMAGILSAAMVIFSIVCIIMFMVNMLQSYFQKVKRNIGTFKAFGMNGQELIQVYIIILISIVLTAVVIALLATWGIQGLLPLLGIEKDGFNYLSLWNTTTYIATAVIFVSTIITVILVMTRLLSQTPGDLIYDRN